MYLQINKFAFTVYIFMQFHLSRIMALKIYLIFTNVTSNLLPKRIIINDTIDKLVIVPGKF